MDTDGLLAKVTSVLVARPGDVLIVALPDKSVSPSQAQEYQGLIHRRLPELADVIVLAATQLAVYRP